MFGPPGKTAAAPEGSTQAASVGTGWDALLNIPPGLVNSPIRQTAEQASTGCAATSTGALAGVVAIPIVVPGNHPDKTALILL